MISPPLKADVLVDDQGRPTDIFYAWLEDVSNRANTSEVATGNGSPEGAIVATKGKFYIDESATELYIKTTDSGSTGWAAV
ncbi:MAG: hypothetical protein CML03_00830 [Pseudooceanicola sp.]|nr:hypothetical protein [Pseudooceanicola sp.]|tara:strand:+ start:21 stop:263 length:243 start_codon:yes stop_codon:yes gene_type:complete